MFNSLLITTLICMGVVNTTPIYTCKEENKQLELTQPKETAVIPETLESSDYELVGQQDRYTDNTGQFRINRQRYNIQKSSQLWNITGNYYKDTAYWVEDRYIDPQNVQINAIGQNLWIMQISLYGETLEELIQMTMQIVLDARQQYNYHVEIETEYMFGIDIQSTWEDCINSNLYANRDWYEEIDLNLGWDWVDYRETEIFGQYPNEEIKTINKTLTYNNIENYRTIYFIMYGEEQYDLLLDGNAEQEPSSFNKSNPTGRIVITYENAEIYEVIDIPGIMFTVLGMPFTFISSAFNLTLFPNTPYQVNISNLFLSILAILIFMWLLKTIIKRM